MHPKTSAQEDSKKQAEYLNEEDGIFNVERILKKDYRKNRGKWQPLYLIKWEGFSESEATWEPLKNLRNVRQMVRDFDKQLQSEKDLPNKPGL